MIWSCLSRQEGSRREKPKAIKIDFSRRHVAFSGHNFSKDVKLSFQEDFPENIHPRLSRGFGIIQFGQVLEKIQPLEESPSPLAGKPTLCFMLFVLCFCTCNAFGSLPPPWPCEWLCKALD